MFFPRFRSILVGLSSALAIGGCAYGDLGGYGGLSVGIGSGGYYDDYHDRGSYYGGHDAYPRYGWYDGYYYPGYGYDVYDRVGRSLAMRAQDRLYWLERRRDIREDRRDARRARRGDGRDERLERRAERGTWTEEQRRHWAAQHPDRREARSQRREERRDVRAEPREQRQARIGRSIGQGIDNGTSPPEGQGRRGKRMGRGSGNIQEP
jgi:hypothetical protein